MNKSNLNGGLTVQDSNSTDVKMFNHPIFGEIRTITIDNSTGEVWFVLKEICDILGYSNPSDVKAKTLRPKDCMKISISNSEVANASMTNLINESGLYRLIIRSNKDNAEPFQDWITDEVLPTIRRTGGYVEDDIMEKMMNDADFALNWLTKYKEEHEKVKELEAKIEKNQPKLEYHDTVLDTRNSMTVTTIAKELEMSAVKLNSILADLGIQYKQGEMWYLYKKYEGKGLTDIRTSIIHKSEDEIESRHSMVWTEKGRKFIHELLRDNEII